LVNDQPTSTIELITTTFLYILLNTLMKEHYRIRRSLSSSLELKATQEHLDHLRRKPSKDILSRSYSNKSLSQSGSILKTKEPSQPKSVATKILTISTNNEKKPNIVLPAIQRNSNRLRLTEHNKILKTEIKLPTVGRQEKFPADSL
jgi:organic radical activating enzyme